MDSHVSIGVDGAVLLHILHLCWVNMLNLLNSLRLDTGDRRQWVYSRRPHHPAGTGGCWGGVPAAGQAPAGWSPEAGQARWSEEGLWRWSQRLLQGSAWRLEGRTKPGGTRSTCRSGLVPQSGDNGQGRGGDKLCDFKTRSKSVKRKKNIYKERKEVNSPLSDGKKRRGEAECNS